MHKGEYVDLCKFIEIIEPVNHGFDSTSLQNSGFLCVTAETLLTECFSCNVTPTFEKKPIAIHVIHFDKSKHEHDFARKLDIWSTLKLKQQSFRQIVIA